MRKKRIIISLVLLLFGACLILSSHILQNYNDNKDKELIDMAFAYANTLKETKSEDDLIKVRELLKNVRDKKEKENI